MIDGIVVTHEHDDHIGGVDAVCAQIWHSGMVDARHLAQCGEKRLRYCQRLMS